jgi:hypothetical protein
MYVMLPLHVEIETNMPAITLCISTAFKVMREYYASSRQLRLLYLSVIYRLCGHDTCQSEAAGRDKTIGALQSTNHLKVKAKFTLKQATKAQRGSRSIALLFL